VARAKKESWLLNQDKILKLLFYLLIIFLPTQFGRHFWPNFSFVQGLRLDYLSPTLYFTDIIVITILFLSAKNIFINLTKINKKIKILILLTFLFLLINVTLSYSPLAGIYELIKISEYFFFGIFIIYNLKSFSKKNIFLSISVAIVFESLLAIFQTLNKGSIGGLLYFLGERTFSSSTPGIANASINGELILRPYATFSHPNVLAGFLIIYMFLLLRFFTKKEKIILYLCLFISSIVLFLTLSRIAILFWIISSVFLFGISIYKKYKNAKLNMNAKNVILFLILFLIFILIFAANVSQRFLSTNIAEQSIVERQELIVRSVDMFINNPIIGVGINNFYFYLTKKDIIQPVHNIFLFILSQGGIFLAATTILLFTKAIKRTLLKKEYYLFFSLICIILVGGFDHYFLTLQQGQLLVVLVLSFVFSKTSLKE
jgi:hypothetical protein